MLPSRKVLKSGSQKTVHVGYVRNTYLIYDSLQSNHEPFLTFFIFWYCSQDLLYLKFSVNFFVKIFLYGMFKIN